MAFIEDALAARYTLVNSRVISSTQIADRTATIVSKLTGQATDSEKPVIVCLTAQARVASKLISVVEIAKRDLASKGINCYQYIALSSQLVDIPPEHKKKPPAPTPVNDGEEEEEDADFQTMDDPRGTTKQRNMPIMTIYLSARIVRELRAEYGEQRQPT